MLDGHSVLASEEAKVYNASSLRLRRDAVPLAGHLQCANMHGVEFHVLRRSSRDGKSRGIFVFGLGISLSTDPIGLDVDGAH